MSKTLESNLWKWLRGNSRGHFLPGELYLGRVENSVSAGDPDLDGCLVGDCFKIELKTAARPSRPGTNVAVKFRPAQVPWMQRYVRAGGSVYALIQVGSGHAAKRYLIHGRDVAAVDQGVPESRLSRLSVTRFDATAVEIIQVAASGLCL